MGNDGGSIPKRRELVKSAARAPNMSELKATTQESQAWSWTHCNLSQEPFTGNDTIVSNWQGKLYNYEHLMAGLVEDPDTFTTEPKTSSLTPKEKLASMGITSLRDIQVLKIHCHTPPGRKDPLWACPISLKTLGPATKAAYLIPCGHVFAKEALREVKERTCPECGTEFEPENEIPILPTDEEDIKRMAERIERLNASKQTHALKKMKADKAEKRKRKAEEVYNGEGTPKEKKTKSEGDKIEKAQKDGRVTGINNALAASLTAKVLAEQDIRDRRRKLERSYNEPHQSRV
jgi:hypothetical protein